MVCYELPLLYPDDCLMEQWQEDTCECPNASVGKQLSRTVLRNATGAGLACIVNDKETISCDCRG